MTDILTIKNLSYKRNLTREFYNQVSHLLKVAK